MILTIHIQQYISAPVSADLHYFSFTYASCCLKMLFYADTVSEVYTVRTITSIQKPKIRKDMFKSVCMWTKTLSLQNENMYILLDTTLTDFHHYILYTENDHVFSCCRHSNWSMWKSPDTLITGCICLIIWLYKCHSVNVFVSIDTRKTKKLHRQTWMVKDFLGGMWQNYCMLWFFNN